LGKPTSQKTQASGTENATSDETASLAIAIRALRDHLPPIQSVRDFTGLNVAEIDAYYDGRMDQLSRREVRAISVAIQELLADQNKRPKLTTLLNHAGLTMEPVEFQKAIIRCFQDLHPEITVDAMLTDPKLSKNFCQFVREKNPLFEEHRIGDYLILRSLMNARKDIRNDRIYRQRARSPRLEKQLQEVGVPLSKDAFIELVQDKLADMYKNRTIDELLVHPTEAEELCENIRRQTGLTQIPSSLILRTLMNQRKAINS
jgi:hypothetical protein